MTLFRNISIKKKLVIIQAVTAFLAILICCAFFLYNDIKLFKESSQKKMYSIAKIAGDNCISPILFQDENAVNSILKNLNKEPDIQDAVVLYSNGNIFGRYSRQPGQPVPEIAFADTLTARFSGNQLLVGYKIYQDNEFTGTLIIRAELSEFNKIMVSYAKAAGAVLLIGLASALLISLFLQRVITNRLLSLVDTTKKVSETKDYSIRVPSDGQDEMGVLSEEFNNMLVEIEKMETSLKDANTGLEKRVGERTAELEAANQEMEAFSYSVSHDLRAPIRAISGFTNIIKEEYYDKLDEDGKHLLNTITGESKRMGQLIDDLLAFSRLGKKEVQKLKVDMTALANEVVEEAQKLAEEKYKGKITVNDLPPANCDKSLISMVFMNLISNAMKFSSTQTAPVIEIGAYLQGGVAVYYVKDNGVGFDMKYYDKLFGVFQRLHSAEDFKGTGIGLATTRRIILKHGGAVWAKGEMNHGATFYFSIQKIKPAVQNNQIPQNEHTYQ